MMQRATLNRQQRELNDLALERQRQAAAAETLMAPVRAAQARADLVKAGTEYDIAIGMQRTREQAQQLYRKATEDLDTINMVEDMRTRALLSGQWVSKYAQLRNVAEIAPQMNTMFELANRNRTDFIQQSTLTSAEVRAFNALTEGFTPEEKTKAAKVKMGLEARPSSAGINYRQVTGPDGRPMWVAFDPREVGARVIGSGETYGSGVSPVEQPAAGTPAQNIFRGQTPGEETKEKEQAKIRVERDAARPKRQTALRMAEATAGRLVDDLDSLIGQVNTLTAGPGGAILEKFPGTAARNLENQLNSIKATLGFQALQAIREASPTGGALGPVSDAENRLLQSQLASLEIGQSPQMLISNIRKVRQRVIENIGIARSGFSLDYGVPSSESAAPPSDLSSQSTEQLEARLKKLRESK